MMDVQACRFYTERLSVCEWAAFAVKAGDGEAVYERIARILSPEATQELPAGWQGVHTARDARAWLANRLNESVVLAVQARLQGALIGFVFLTESPSPIERTMEVRLGYVLSKEIWGKGIGSELISGLVGWCAQAGGVAKLVGGVGAKNASSAKVLKKTGLWHKRQQLPKTSCFGNGNFSLTKSIAAFIRRFHLNTPTNVRQTVVRLPLE